MSDSMRRDPRYASPRGLVVRCESWGEFVERYASDISQGGMYILTDQTPPILSEIDVVLQLPEGHEVQLRASVVHVIDAERSVLEGRDAGVGVQFVQLDAARKAQIHQLVEYARWEGGSGGASLASRMFEVSASLPPSKIIDALPVAVRVQPSAAPGGGPPPLRGGASVSRRPSPTSSPAASSNAPAARGGANSNRAPNASGRPRPQGSKAPTPPPGSIKAPTPLPGSIKAPTPLPGSIKAPTPIPGSLPAAVHPDAGAQDAASTSSGAPAAQAPSQPLDHEKLKLGMTHLAHKRLEQALQLFAELARDSHAEPQPHLWLSLTHARIRVRDNDEAGAAEHYRRVLAIDEGHHEARKFVRDYHSKRRLSAIPFGRYFLKK